MQVYCYFWACVAATLHAISMRLPMSKYERGYDARGKEMTCVNLFGSMFASNTRLCHWSPSLKAACKHASEATSKKQRQCRHRPQPVLTNEDSKNEHAAENIRAFQQVDSDTLWIAPSCHHLPV